MVSSKRAESAFSPMDGFSIVMAQPPIENNYFEVSQPACHPVALHHNGYIFNLLYFIILN
jgi:hypothetical protein